MKIYHSFQKLLILLVTVVFAAGCSDEKLIDNRDHIYGSVQFRLSKKAESRATSDQLNYLSEANKIKVNLLNENNQSISQTIQINFSDPEAAEYGIRSDIFKLLVGTYSIQSYQLFDKVDDPIYYESMDERLEFVVKEGELTQVDLQAVAVNRGKVRFEIHPDFSNLTRASVNYVLSDATKFSLTFRNDETNRITSFENLPAKYDKSDNYIYCDSLISIVAGSYTLESIVLEDKNTVLNVHADFAEPYVLQIRDNEIKTVELEAAYESTNLTLIDYVSLKRIWDSLDGENWFYEGEDYTEGTNWNFNKPIDQWGDQPGVILHSNGRVGALDIGGFGPKGHLSPAIGNLTELADLYMGTSFDDERENKTGLTRKRSIDRLGSYDRIENDKYILRSLYQPEQTALRRMMAEEQGVTLEVLPELKSVAPGVLNNGILSLPEELGNCTKLSYLFLANSKVAELPSTFNKLTSLTDLELYNLPYMTEFPDVIAELPELISVNLGANEQWSAQQIYDGLDLLFNGAAQEKLQILYCSRGWNLEKFPPSAANVRKLSLLDLSMNKLKEMPSLPNIRPVQVYLDWNDLETVPNDVFSFLDTEIVSFKANKFKLLPDIFSAESVFAIEEVYFNQNEMTGVAEGFRGIRADILDCSSNKFTRFPSEFAQSESDVLNFVFVHNFIEEIPEDAIEGLWTTASFNFRNNLLSELPESFSGKNLPYIQGLDIGYNCFDKFPTRALASPNMHTLIIRDQHDGKGNRVLRSWPAGISQHTGLRRLDASYNDLREVEFPSQCHYLDIRENPNIYIEVDEQPCYRIVQWGTFEFYYDKTQNIVGWCAPYLGLE